MSGNIAFNRRAKHCVLHAALLAVFLGAVLTGALQLSGSLTLAAEQSSSGFSPNMAGLPSEAPSTAKIYATANVTSLIALAGPSGRAASPDLQTIRITSPRHSAIIANDCARTPFGRAPPSSLA